MNINQIAENILTEWGRIKITHPEYTTLKETIKDKVKEHASTYIRRDLDRNGKSEAFITRLIVELIPVTIGNNIKVLRTKNQIAEPIRLKGSTDFTYVGSVDGLQPFGDAEFYELVDIASLEITSGKPRFSRKNNYLYIINTIGEQEELAVEAAFLEIIDGAINVDDVRNFNVTYEFPVTRDVIQLITKYIIEELNQTNEVKPIN